jgi:hypothetical protein
MQWIDGALSLNAGASRPTCRGTLRDGSSYWAGDGGIHTFIDRRHIAGVNEPLSAFSEFLSGRAGGIRLDALGRKTNRITDVGGARPWAATIKVRTQRQLG